MPYKDPALRKEKHKGYAKKWYSLNRAKQIQKSINQKRKVRVLWNEYKAKQKCSHCGIQHPAVIDFHHIIKEGKQSVNDLIAHNNSFKAAVQEVEEKCIPLCSNCHRMLHWQEHEEQRKKRKWKLKMTF